MIALVLFKIAMTALVVFAVRMMTEGFCNYENPAKGIKKQKVPEFVPIVGGFAFTVFVIAAVASVVAVVWA